MKTNGQNATQVATTNGNQPSGTLKGWLNERRNTLTQSLPMNTVNIDRFMQSAYLAITNPKQPDLVKCTKDSIFRSLNEAASYGLELNGTLGQAYLIPYNESVQVAQGKWEKQMTCHFQMGYKGLISLARRSNTIKTIAAEPIYENDIVDIELGMNRHLSHKIDITKERGEIIAYYCLVELTNGGVQFEIMTKKDVENHRAKFSKSYKKDDPNNIWNKNFDAMALKTCVIKTLKLCPISIEALEAISKEEMEEVKIADEGDYTIQDEPVAAIENNTVQQIENNSVPMNQQMPENGFSAQENAMLNAAFDSLPPNQQENGDIF